MENRNTHTRVVFEVHFTEKGSSKVVQWLALALHNKNTVVSWGLSVWSVHVQICARQVDL